MARPIFTVYQLIGNASEEEKDIWITTLYSTQVCKYLLWYKEVRLLEYRLSTSDTPSNQVTAFPDYV